MARKKLIDLPNMPYHLTARGNNRERFPGDLNYTWRVFNDELYLQSLRHGFRVHAFVLMPNHYHLLATSPFVSIAVVMSELQASTTRRLNEKNSRSGRIYGGPYHWSLIPTAQAYANVLKYVYRNPVKAELCANVGDYRFSTFSGVLGRTPLLVALHEPLRELSWAIRPLLDEPTSLEAWLNIPHRREEYEVIRKALRKREFTLDVNRNNRKTMRLTSPVDAAPSPESA